MNQYSLDNEIMIITYGPIHINNIFIILCNNLKTMNMSIARIGQYPQYNVLKKQRFTTIIEQKYTKEIKQVISTQDNYISLINRAFEDNITIEETKTLSDLLSDMIIYYEDKKPSDEIIRQLSMLRKSITIGTKRNIITSATIIRIYNHFNNW